MKTKFLIALAVCGLASLAAPDRAEATHVSGSTDATHHGFGETVGLADHIATTAVSATSAGASTRDKSEMINGSGLGADGLHQNGANCSTHWDSGANKPIQDVGFTLDTSGGTHDLGSIVYWSFSGLKAAQDVEILVADDAGGAYTSLGVFEFQMTDGTSLHPGSSVDVTGIDAATANVGRVRFIITTNWVDVSGKAICEGLGTKTDLCLATEGDGTGGWLMGDTSFHNQSRVGFAEVQFFAVPEPSGIATSMVALVVIGLFGVCTLRRRKRVAT